jgi:hypothetical protein
MNTGVNRAVNDGKRDMLTMASREIACVQPVKQFAREYLSPETIGVVTRTVWSMVEGVVHAVVVIFTHKLIDTRRVNERIVGTDSHDGFCRISLDGVYEAG